VVFPAQATGGLNSGDSRTREKLQRRKPKETKMKAFIPTTTIILFSTFGALAQGTINFNIRVPGVIVAHVYIPEFDHPSKYGNTASETPTGTQTYLFGVLEGSGFSAQLFGGPLGTPEFNLVAIGSPSPFRTGATFGGTPVPQMLIVPGVPAGATGTFQIRVWDNGGGTFPTFTIDSTWGLSALFNVSNLGDGLLMFPADMANFRSFNLWGIPEPSTYALVGLGGLGLWIFRRKKPAA
jgi:hypothetical protein